MAAKKLIVENRSRDIKHLGRVVVDGDEHELTLGSSDDAGIKFDPSSEFKPPKAEVDPKIWNAFMDRKAVAGWVEDGSISVYGKA